MGARFKFIHCADLHLGSRFRGMSEADPATAERMRRSVFESFSRIVDLCGTEGADAMFVSGDAFDESTATPSTRMFLARELGRAGVPVFICRGNHDPRTSWDSAIPYPGNVHEFGTEPERLEIPGVEGAEAVGVSFADWHDSRNLPSMLRGSPDMFTVACVHCDVDNPSAEYAYSPCTSADFLGKGVDYWALGHVHRRRVIRKEPWVVYPGNIQGRSFRETGEKGAYVVTVSGGMVRDVRFAATQGVVWHDVAEDIGGMSLQDLVADVRAKVPEGSAARVTLTGSGELDAMARRTDLAPLLSRETGAAVSEVEVRTSPAVDLDARRGGRDMVGMLIASGDAMASAGRAEILGALAANPVAKANMDFYESLTDEDLRSLVESAVRLTASRMEAGR